MDIPTSACLARSQERFTPSGTIRALAMALDQPIEGGRRQASWSMDGISEGVSETRRGMRETFPKKGGALKLHSQWYEIGIERRKQAGQSSHFPHTSW